MLKTRANFVIKRKLLSESTPVNEHPVLVIKIRGTNIGKKNSARKLAPFT